MQLLHIDSASFTEVLQYFNDLNYSWAIETAIDFTTACILWPHVQIAMPVQEIGPASGDYAIMWKELSEIFPIRNVKDSYSLSIRDKALAQTSDWLGKNLDTVKSALETTKSDPSYEQWLEGAQRFGWEEQSRRLGGLFNSRYIRELETIIVGENGSLERAFDIASDPLKVRALIGERSEMVKLISEAYTAAVLIRGYFHDRVIELTPGTSIYHHRLRWAVISTPQPDVSSNFDAEEAWRFAWLLLELARAGSDMKTRCRRYAHFLKGARANLERMDFRRKPTVDDLAKSLWQNAVIASQEEPIDHNRIGLVTLSMDLAHIFELFPFPMIHLPLRRAPVSFPVGRQRDTLKRYPRMWRTESGATPVARALRSVQQRCDATGQWHQA